MNKREFIKTLIDMGGCGAEPKTWDRGWDDAIGEVIEIAKELDEPEQTDTNVGLLKPVIPKFVAEWFENDKRDMEIEDVFWQIENCEMVKLDVDRWISDNRNTFIRAWLDGYEVEKEKLYRVRAGNRYVRFNLDGSIIGVKKDNSIVCLERLSKLPFDYKKAVESGIVTLEEVTE